MWLMSLKGILIRDSLGETSSTLNSGGLKQVAALKIRRDSWYNKGDWKLFTVAGYQTMKLALTTAK